MYTYNYKNNSHILNSNINFKQMTLSPKISEQVNKLISDYATKSDNFVARNNLFYLVQKELDAEAIIKSKEYIFILDDVKQDLYEFFFNAIEDVKLLSNPVKELCNLINNYKPNQEEKNPQYRMKEVSLEKKIYQSNITLGETLSNEDKLTPTSQPNEKEVKLKKQELEKKLANTNLTEREKEIIRLKAAGKTYTDIGKLYNVSNVAMRLNILTAIAKIQDSYDVLPKEYEEKATELINTLGIKSDSNKIIEWLIKHPQILPTDEKKIKNNMVQLARALNMKYESCINCAMKQPSLFFTPFETIVQKIEDMVALFEKDGLTIEKYVKICEKSPSLFTQSVQTIAEHIKAYQYVAKNNNTKYKYENVLEVIQNKCLIHSNTRIYLRGIILPQLRMQGAEISLEGDYIGLEDKIVKYLTEHSDKKFTINLVEDEMTDKCIKTIQQFCKNNLGRENVFLFSKYTKEQAKKELEDRLANSGLTEKEKDFIRLKTAGKRYEDIAALYNVSTQTVHRYVIKALAKMQEQEGGLDPKYEKKAKEFIQIVGLKSDVETIKQWLIKHPEVLPKDSKELKENISYLSQKFNVSYNKLLEYAIKSTELLYLSPKIIEEKINAFVYSQKNNPINTNIDIDKIISHKNLKDSVPVIFCRDIIVPQLKQQGINIAKFNMKELSQRLAENPEKKFTIKCVKDEMTNYFVQTVQNFCKTTVGREDIFDYIVVKRQTV